MRNEQWGRRGYTALSGVLHLCGCAGAQENAQVYRDGARALAQAVGVGFLLSRVALHFTFH